MAVPQQGGDTESVTAPAQHHSQAQGSLSKHPAPHQSTARLVALKNEAIASPFLFPFLYEEHLITAEW